MTVTLRTLNSSQHLPKGYTRINGRYVSESNKGICFKMDYGNMWLPKSRVYQVNLGMFHAAYYAPPQVINSAILV